MSLPENMGSMIPFSLWRQANYRRLIPLGIAVVILLMIGFYAVTNGNYLEHDHILEGADWVGYAFCHRITERSFTINGRQFPLCARCSGMYLGVALVFFVMLLSGRMRRALLPPLPLLLVLCAFIALMGIDGLNSYSHFFPNAPHLYEPQNWLRLLTGMGTGLAMGLLLLPALAQTLWRQPQFQAIIDTRRELIELIILALILIIILLSNLSPLLYVLALVSVGGLLLIISALNTIILLAILRKDGRANSWKDTILPLMIGFLIAIIQISIISTVRFNITGTMTGFPGL